MVEERIASWLVRIIAITLFVQLVMCHPLWLVSQRTFPTVPTIPFLKVQWGCSVDWLLYLALLGSCLALIIKPFSRKALGAITITFLLLLLEDISRLQPWFYLYMLMLSSLFFYKKENAGHMLTIFRIVLSSVYFWSGLQKLNIHFAIEVFPWFFNFIGVESYLDKHHLLAYIAALLETSAGICLWVRPLRKPACLFIITTHLLVLISLGPLSHNWNSIVWPWNILFAWMLFELFYRTEPKNLFPLKIKSSGFNRYHLSSILLLATIMPGFGLVGNWDHFLSDGFYSAMPDEPAFYLPISEAGKLPALSEDYQYIYPDENEVVLRFSYWSVDEMNVPVYPQDWVYKEVARKLSGLVKDYDSTGLRITQKYRWKEKEREKEWTYRELTDKH